MYMGLVNVSRSCKLLPKVISTVQRATTLVELRYYISIWHQLRLDGPPTCLYTSLPEDKKITCSEKTLANTKEEQLGSAPKELFLSIYPNDSSTEDSDFDGYEQLEAELKAIDRADEEARTHEQMLSKFKEEEIYRYDPSTKYEPLKRYDVPRFVFSEDFSTIWSDSKSDTRNENMAEEEAQTQKDKIIAGTKEELLSHYELAKSPTSTDLQSVAQDLAVSPSTEGGIKDLKQAKEMDWLVKLANDDQKKCEKV